MELSKSAIDKLSKEGYDPQYGARPLKRLIQNKILTPIASLMISKGVLKGGTITVDVAKDEFTFDVRKGRKGSIWAQSIIEESSTKKS